MEIVKYEDIEGIFSHIWGNGYESYFYSSAWEILTEKGLTQYASDEEQIRVFIRAIALYTIVGEFSQVAFDETFCYSTVTEKLAECGDDIDYFELMLGQMYAKISESDELTDDLGEVAFELVNAEKEKVVNALESGLGIDLSVLLYAVVAIDSVLDEEGECVDEDGNLVEVEAESIYSSEDFWKMLGKHADDFAYNPDEGLVRGYDWFSQGTPAIGYRD